MLIPKKVLFKVLKIGEFWGKSLGKCMERYQEMLEDEMNISFIANNKQRHLLKVELDRLRNTSIQKHKKGGRQHQEFIKKLENAMYHWNVGLDRHKIQAKLEQKTIENDKILLEKSKLENTISYLSTENEKLIEKLKKQSESEKSNLTSTPRVGLKRKLSDCTPSYKSKVRKFESQKCKTSLSFLKEFNCQPISVNVMRDNGRPNVITLVDSDKSVKDDTTSLSVDEIEELNMLIYVLDSFNISGNAYHEISMLYHSLPRSYKLSQYILHLNSGFDIRDTPDGSGVQQSLKVRLEAVISDIVSDNPEFAPENVLKIKISGDGTRVGKHMNFVNFTFTVMNDSKCVSVQGNYPLAIVKTKEAYDELRHALTDLRNEVRDLQGLKLDIGERSFHVKIYLGGDYKFLLMALGMSSIQANYNCIYCNCSRNERCDLSKCWSLTDKEKGARVEYTCQFVSRGKQHKRSQVKPRQSFSVVNPLLFPEIPLCDVVVDILHLFLRIMDKLLALLITELRTVDNISSQRSLSAGVLDKTKLKCIPQFENVLQNIGVKFVFFINKNKEFEYTDLQGPDKEIVLGKLQIKDLGLSEERSSQIQEVWNQFSVINTMLKSRCDVNELVEKVDAWCSLCWLTSAGTLHHTFTYSGTTSQSS
ncbi:uncharacterized protein LOC132545546 [Ylistrum balloti]|uniref:uncharacterized protein LOC132545546 n=1 Tax=Ylistrum balloti TaxID=509963 RepID=UPI0029059323|nr:uncharacterized protein LOC132545546 [Ylistrum balloti]